MLKTSMVFQEWIFQTSVFWTRIYSFWAFPFQKLSVTTDLQTLQNIKPNYPRFTNQSLAQHTALAVITNGIGFTRAGPFTMPWGTRKFGLGGFGLVGTLEQDQKKSRHNFIVIVVNMNRMFVMLEKSSREYELPGDQYILGNTRLSISCFLEDTDRLGKWSNR